MAIIEKKGVLCDAQAISATNTWSTGFFDMALANNGYGIASNLHLCIRVAVAPTDTADTCAIQVQTSATNDATNLTGTIVNLYTIIDDAAAEYTVSNARFATAGAWVIRMPLPYEWTLRYLQLKFLQTTSNGTQTYDAWVEQAPQDYGTQVIDSPVGTPS